MYRELLSLFPTFEAIAVEGSISKAAARLGVSQSAVSQSLARLRQLLSDELFVSTGRGMTPTPRAALVLPHVTAAMACARAASQPGKFDPRDLTGTVVIDLGAGIDALLLPIIRREISQAAPRLRLQATNMRSLDPTNALRLGEIQLAVEIQSAVTDDIRAEEIIRSPAVVIARKGHPAFQTELTEQMYFGLEHAALNWNRPNAPSGVAMELRRLGKEVKPVVTVPTLSGFAAVIEGSDLIGTVIEAAATELCARYQLTTRPLPFPMPAARFYQIWHARYDIDPSHVWLRKIVSRAAAEQAARPLAPAG